MNRKQIAIALLLLAVQSALVSADLPVHCLKNQVIGKWILKESKVMAENNFQPLSCGHQTPDKAETSYKSMGGVLTEVQKEIEVTLEDDFTVRGREGKGRWTLIYDEGWEIEYNGVKYTHFFKYVKESNGEFKSNCSATLVGWYNHIQRKSRGCSQASKADGDSGLSSNVEQAHVVQPKDSSMFIFSEISSTMHKLDQAEQQKKIQNPVHTVKPLQKQKAAKLKLQRNIFD